MASTMHIFLLYIFLLICWSDSGHCRLEPSSCAELWLEGTRRSGVYTINPRQWFRKASFQVYCDMETDGGGWTVFQRRGDFKMVENFYRGWDDYRSGFGNLQQEFWLGNDHLHLLTSQDRVTLRIDLKDFDNHTRFATYKTFEVANWNQRFKLKIDDYRGDAGDNMGNLSNVTFVTFDNGDLHNCSQRFKGGWWYTNCHSANLNGLNLKGNHSSFADGINWHAWKGYNYSLKSEMKLRPKNFFSCDL